MTNGLQTDKMARERDKKGRFLPGNKEGNRFPKGVSGNPLGGGLAKKLSPREQLRLTLTQAPVPEPIKKMFHSMYGYDPENLIDAINGVTMREALSNGNMKAVNALYKAAGMFDTQEDEQQQGDNNGKPRKYVVNVIKTRKVDEDNERTEE